MALAVILFAAADGQAQDEVPPREKNWGLALYWGTLTDASLGYSATFQCNFTDAQFLALALSRRLYTFRDLGALEVEGIIVKHFQEQHHFEFDALGAFRWLKFPWNRYLGTSVAAGLGLSYATENPEMEVRKWGKTSKFLLYFMVEAAFSLPAFPQWELMARLHHRSGAGGVFDGVWDASNAWGLGLRYRF